MKKISKLSLIGWIASTLSLVGVILNSYKNIWCWLIWCIANLFWIYWSIKKKEWSQLVLWIVFTIANLYGWYQWSL